jgi:hypothetical protein
MYSISIYPESHNCTTKDGVQEYRNVQLPLCANPPAHYRHQLYQGILIGEEFFSVHKTADCSSISKDIHVPQDFSIGICISHSKPTFSFFIKETERMTGSILIASSANRLKSIPFAFLGLLLLL